MNENEKLQQENARTLAKTVVEALESKKAGEVKTLAVASKTVLADYFVVATGTSSTHIRTLADETEFHVQETLGVKPLRVEGFSDNAWTLIDYGSVIVHVFTPEAHDFYDLEHLWADAKELPAEEWEEKPEEQA